MKKSKNIIPKERMIDMQGEMSNHLTTIRGLVIPVEWDDEGNILNLGISTYDEDEYWIEMDQRMKQMISILRKEVEVTGLVAENEGRKKIVVKKINPNPVKVYY